MSDSEKLITNQKQTPILDKQFARSQLLPTKRLMLSDFGVIISVVSAAILVLYCGFLTWHQNQCNNEIRRIKQEFTHLQHEMMKYGKPNKNHENIEQAFAEEYQDYQPHVRRRRDPSSARNNLQQRGQRHRPRRCVMHLQLDSDHLREALERESNGGEMVNYAGSDIRWKESQRISSMGCLQVNNDFRNVTVNESGVYFVYGQLTYFNRATKSAFALELNGQPILKCLQSVDAVHEISGSHASHSAAASTGSSARTSDSGSKPKTCYTAGVVEIHANSYLSISNRDRAVLNDSHSNYWGLFKLTDM